MKAASLTCVCVLHEDYGKIILDVYKIDDGGNVLVTFYVSCVLCIRLEVTWLSKQGVAL